MLFSRITCKAGRLIVLQRPCQSAAERRAPLCLFLPLINISRRHLHTERPFALLRLHFCDKKSHFLPFLHRRCLSTSPPMLSFFRRSRGHASMPLTRRERDINTMCYSLGMIISMLGVCYAALPLYKLFCDATGFAGTTQVAKSLERIVNMERVEDRLIRVQFNADLPSSMQWKFKPIQDEIYVYPGETALAFFTALNPTDKPIIGISTYNLTPFQAAYYFNKIQCFCFDEQILNPGEQVDLPVFFYIDPDFANDPNLEGMDDLLLSYTFFESKSGLQLPSPFDPNNRPLNQRQQALNSNS